MDRAQETSSTFPSSIIYERLSATSVTNSSNVSLPWRRAGEAMIEVLEDAQLVSETPSELCQGGG